MPKKTTTKTNPIWRNVDGEWLVQIPKDPGFLVETGIELQVYRRDGTSSTQTLKSCAGRTATGLSLWTVETVAKPANARLTSESSQRSSPTKRCWECGCEFTYSDAKRNDGDWKDSYCGC